MFNRQIDKADAELEKIVKADEVAMKLCTVPGVGPVTNGMVPSTYRTPSCAGDQASPTDEREQSGETSLAEFRTSVS